MCVVKHLTMQPCLIFHHRWNKRGPLGGRHWVNALDFHERPNFVHHHCLSEVPPHWLQEHPRCIQNGNWTLQTIAVCTLRNKVISIFKFPNFQKAKKRTKAWLFDLFQFQFHHLFKEGGYCRGNTKDFVYDGWKRRHSNFGETGRV